MPLDASTIRLIDPEPLEGLRQLQEPGEPDVVLEVVSLFSVNSAGRLQSARKAAAAGDTVALANTAHQLKGSAALIGADRIVALAVELETAAKQGAADQAAALVEQLIEAFGETRAALEGLNLGGASST